MTEEMRYLLVLVLFLFGCGPPKQGPVIQKMTINGILIGAMEEDMRDSRDICASCQICNDEVCVSVRMCCDHDNSNCQDPCRDADYAF